MNEETLFHLALEHAAPERRDFLDQACAGDAGLRRRVEILLEAYENPASILGKPAVNLLATVDSPSGQDASGDDADSSSLREGPGTVIGPYKLLEQIGEGGFGVVFMAEQTEPVRRKVALKILKAGMDTKQVIARFEAERQALALMDHPHIAHVHDGGTTESGRPYFVMELVKGIPITEYCDTKKIDMRERLQLFLQVCQAVQHAHQKGIIHRDIKPNNVLVTPHDGVPVVKVIDFGIAKAMSGQLTDKTIFTAFAQMIGTPLYMSPEQAEINALEVDTRSDVYSLGVLLYELLTGTTPFDKERMSKATFDELRKIIREEEPPRPSARISTMGKLATTVSDRRKIDPRKLSHSLRGELDWVVMRALEKDRRRRYETANAFGADVQRYMNDEPVQARPATAWYRFQKFARRKKSALAVTACIFLAFAGIAGGMGWAVRDWGAREEAIERERRTAYFYRIALAHQDLSAANLSRSLKLLRECPQSLRQWEWYYLMRLSRVEPLVLRDKSELKAVAFSPNGEWVASAGGDESIKIWDSTTGDLLWTLLHAHAGSVACVVFHPDGKHLASVGGDRKAKVWDLVNRREVVSFPCDRLRTFGAAWTVAFSPRDGGQLAVGSEGLVNVWDWKKGQLLHTFPGHDHHTISVAYSRDGRRLATGSWREGLRLWDPTTGGQPLRTFPGHRHPVSALAFSPDGARLASASMDRSVKVWDTSTGQLLHTLPDTGNVLCVAFSPDGQRLASAGEGKTVRIWDAQTGREVLGLRGHKGMCGCVTFSPDGRRLASASTDGTIRIWDATPLRGDERQEILTFAEHRDEIRSVGYSPDGRWLASAGFGSDVKVWDAATGAVISPPFGGHADVVFCVAWHPDSRRIASAGSDGRQQTVWVWDVPTGKPIFQLPPGPERFAVAFSPDGGYLVTGSGDGAVQVWDAGTGREVCTLGTHARAVRGVVFSPDSRYLASASSDGVVKLWDAARLNQKQEPLHIFHARVPGPSLNVAFSPDGRRLATGGERNMVKIWDVQSGREFHRPLEGHSGEVYTVAFSPDGRWVASGGEDSTVKIWNSHTGKLARTFRGHTGLISSVAFSPDGRRLVSGGRDHTIKVWDLTPLHEALGRQ